LKHRIAIAVHTHPAKTPPHVPSARQSTPPSVGMTRQIPSNPTATPHATDARQITNDVPLIREILSLFMAGSSLISTIRAQVDPIKSSRAPPRNLKAVKRPPERFELRRTQTAACK